MIFQGGLCPPPLMKKLLALTCLLTALQWHSFADTIHWNAPITVSTPNVNASDPQIVVDPSGNATSVWVENNIIQSSHLPSGGSWSALTSISSTGASTPRLGIDTAGNVTAVWLENGIVSSATLPAGGSWSAETAVSSSGASSVALSLDNSGNACAVWIRNGLVESAQKLVAGIWGTVSVLSTGGAETHPDVNIGPSGIIFAVWHSSASGSNIITAAKGSVGGAWGTPANIIAIAPALLHDFPKVLVDSNGNATAIWYRYNLSGSTYTNVTVLSATLLNGSSTWSPTILSNQGMLNLANFAFLNLRIDGMGNILAGWVNSYDGSTFTVETAVKPLSQAWQTGGLLDVRDPYSYQLGTSVASNGDALVAYMFFDGTNLTIQSTETSIGGIRFNFFSPPVAISQGTDNAYPRMSSQYSNNVVNAACVWLQNNGTNNVVQAVTGSKETVAPPTNLSVVQNSINFGVFTENFNTLTWTASTDPNLIEYLIFRNSVLVRAVASSTLQFVDQNVPSSGSTVYGVAAVTSGYIVSPITTVTFQPVMAQ